MPATERLVVDVPTTLASALREQVSAGRYDSLSDAVTAGLEAMAEDDRGVEAWLRDVVVPICDSVDAGTATLLSLEEARARLKAGR